MFGFKPRLGPKILLTEQYWFSLTQITFKLTHLIYGALKTRQPFDANWAKKATEVIEVAVAVVVPLKITVATLDFQEGI